MTELQILPLTHDDIPRAMEFVTAAGWNQVAETWSRFISFQPTGCFKASSAGEMVGTVTSTCYGADLAWIGMMLVAPEMRRQGVGRALMLHVIDYLQARQMKTIKLDATPLGRPLYEKLGFRAQYDFYRWRREAVEGDARSQDSESIAQMPEPLRVLDRRAFGLDRFSWLTAAAEGGLLRMNEQAFGMLRPGRISQYVGPITATSFDAALPIIEELCAATRAPLMWDIPQEDHRVYDLARKLGFSPLRPLTRMVLGEDCTQPDIRLQWGICDPASG